MKIIVDRKGKNSFSYHFRNCMRNMTILLSYTIGFCLYALVFCIWRVEIKNLSIYWIFIPISGFVLGIAHLIFIYKGSLTCRAITMFAIMIFVFAIPFIALFI